MPIRYISPPVRANAPVSAPAPHRAPWSAVVRVGLLVWLVAWCGPGLLFAQDTAGDSPASTVAPATPAIPAATASPVAPAATAGPANTATTVAPVITANPATIASPTAPASTANPTALVAPETPGPVAPASPTGSGAENAPPPKPVISPAPSDIPDTVASQGNWFTRELQRLKSYPHLDKAYRLLAQNRPGEAIQEFMVYLELMPADAKARETLVNTLAGEGRLDEAVGQADQGLEITPGQVRLRLARAFLYSRLGRDEAAAEDFSQVTQEGGDEQIRHQALSGLAAVRLRQGRCGDALSQLDKLPPPQAVPVLLLRGQALLCLSRAPEAVRQLEQAWAQATAVKDKEAILMAWAQGLTSLDDYPGAEGLLRQALDLAPDDPAVLRSLAENALKRQASDQALEYARRAEAANSAPASREMLANVLMAAGKPFEAAEIFADLAAKAANASARGHFLLSRGYALSAAHKDTEAVQAFAEAARDGQGAVALESQATSLERLGSFNEAARVLEEALSLTPGMPLMLRLAALKAKAGFPGEAAELLRQAVAKGLTPEAETAARVELGALLVQTGEDAAALEAWKAALARKPGDPALLARMAELSQRLGDIQGAIAYAQAARQAHPSVETVSALSVLTAKSGQAGKAAEILRQALPMVPSQGDEEARLLEMLAVLENMAGRHAQAGDLFLASYTLLPQGRDGLLDNAGVSYLEGGKPAKAQAVFERLLKIPGLAAGLRAQGQAHLGAAFLQLGLDQQAAGQLGQALDSSGLPKAMRLDALVNLAAVEQRLGHPDRAVELFSQALADGLEPWRARFSMGLALYQARRYDAALEQLQQALELKPQPRIRLAMANCYIALGKPGLAISFMEGVDPARSGLSEEEQRLYFFSLGNLFAQTESTRKAAQAYRASLALKPDPAVTIRLARMERIEGNPQEALRLLESVQAGLPPQPGPAPSGVVPAAPSAAAPAPARTADAAKSSSSQPRVPMASAVHTASPQRAANAPNQEHPGETGGASVPRTLQEIVLTDGPDGVTVLLKGADKDIVPKTIALDAPYRLAVDLPGAWKYTGPNQLPGTGGMVQRIRVGHYPDKLRVVLDLAAGTGKPALENLPSGLLVRLGK